MNFVLAITVVPLLHKDANCSALHSVKMHYIRIINVTSLYRTVQNYTNLLVPPFSRSVKSVRPVHRGWHRRADSRDQHTPDRECPIAEVQPGRVTSLWAEKTLAETLGVECGGMDSTRCTATQNWRMDVPRKLAALLCPPLLSTLSSLPPLTPTCFPQRRRHPE